MIIKTKRITSKNDTPPGTNSKTQVEVKEKKAPGFREKTTKSSTSSITTSDKKHIKDSLVSSKMEKQINNEIKNIKDNISRDLGYVEDSFK